MLRSAVPALVVLSASIAFAAAPPKPGIAVPHTDAAATSQGIKGQHEGRSAPYMHDGSLKTLEEVGDFYDKGRETEPESGPEN
jgi:hypothetical protein